MDQNIQDNIMPFAQPPEFYIKRGDRLCEEGDLPRALAAYRTALRMSPDDPHYALAVASHLCVRMDSYELSNQIALPFMFCEDDVHYPEFCFVAGSNFMGMGYDDQAAELLERYVALRPDGIWNDDALEMLEMLEFYRDKRKREYEGEAGKIRREIDEMDEQAQSLMRQGRFEEATSLIRRVQDMDPGYLPAVNQRAFLLFTEGLVDQAIAMEEEVLRKNKDDLGALCNLALFLREGQPLRARDVGMRALVTRWIEPEDRIKVGMMLCELGEPEAALEALDNGLDLYPYDLQVLFVTAAADYNAGHFGEALKRFELLCVLDDTDTVAAYYAGQAKRKLAGEDAVDTVDYAGQVPYTEILDRLLTLQRIFSPEHEDEALVRWKQEPEFRALLGWALTLGEVQVREWVLQLLIRVRDRAAEDLLKKTLLSRDSDFWLRKSALEALEAMNAKGPYLAMTDKGMIAMQPANGDKGETEQ